MTAFSAALIATLSSSEAVVLFTEALNNSSLALTAVMDLYYGATESVAIELTSQNMAEHLEANGLPARANNIPNFLEYKRTQDENLRSLSARLVSQGVFRR